MFLMLTKCEIVRVETLRCAQSGTPFSVVLSRFCEGSQFLVFSVGFTVKAEILHFVQNDRKNARVVNAEMLGSAYQDKVKMFCR